MSSGKKGKMLCCGFQHRQKLDWTRSDHRQDQDRITVCVMGHITDHITDQKQKWLHEVLRQKKTSSGTCTLLCHVDFILK